MSIRTELVERPLVDFRGEISFRDLEESIAQTLNMFGRKVVRIGISPFEMARINRMVNKLPSMAAANVPYDSYMAGSGRTQMVYAGMTIQDDINIKDGTHEIYLEEKDYDQHTDEF